MAEKLIARLQAQTGCSNELDVLVEVALFKPDAEYLKIRANNAGTKVIYTRADGSEATHWAADWTQDRHGAVSRLRARPNSKDNANG